MQKNVAKEYRVRPGVIA
jgi:hypothetical protein